MLIIHDNGQITTKAVPSPGGGGSPLGGFLGSIIAGGAAGAIAGVFISRPTIPGVAVNTDPPEIEFPEDNESPLGLWQVVTTIFGGEKWYSVPAEADRVCLGPNTLPRQTTWRTSASAVSSMQLTRSRQESVTIFNSDSAFKNMQLGFFEDTLLAGMTIRATPELARNYIAALIPINGIGN